MLKLTRNFSKFLLLLFLQFPILIFTSELTRCCSGGSRHFKETNSCHAIRSEGSSITCSRTASICCLRAMLDNSCILGLKNAQEFEYCPADKNELGAAIKKECCDCCLLAKDLTDRGEKCVAPIGFSTPCLSSFNKCCGNTTSNNIFEKNMEKEETRLNKISKNNQKDRCKNSKCEHFCNDRRDDEVECSCKPGYDLAPDGFTCIDMLEKINKNDISVTNLKYEKRENFYNKNCSTGFIANPFGRCVDINECDTFFHVCFLPNTQCLNVPGSYSCVCLPGYYWSDIGNACLDIDECLLLLDDCLESQRCLNTPGSFKCIRTLSCGTGYALDSETELCMDVDECNLGSHDCGAMYTCRNIQGSYRCDPKKCASDEVMNPKTGECVSITCPLGYLAKESKCQDINECLTPGVCKPYEECINTPGSYRCQEVGNLCEPGTRVDKHTGFCQDIDECSEGTHTCGSQECINTVGSYKCICKAGYEFNKTSLLCEDINECEKYKGHVCSLHAVCENTIGSFKCHCNPGYESAGDGKNCVDVDECSLGIGNCQQRCINTPGSFQCVCDRGYQLKSDNTTCEDIDECASYANTGNELCMGGCVNTIGSFKCNCPPGYSVMEDGIVCKDIDECAEKKCPKDNICVNTLGSYKCHKIKCPRNYYHDKHNKNRCLRSNDACRGLSTSQCKKIPLHITWQYMAIPKHVNISLSRTSIILFSLKGPSNANNHVQYELNVKDVLTDKEHVIPAVRSNFLIQKGNHINSAVVSLRDSLDGPQEIHLEMVLRLSVNNNFQQIHIEQGYSCLKRCYQNDIGCKVNNTLEILYQFRSIPTITHLPSYGIEVAKIGSRFSPPYTVEYILETANRDYFTIEQHNFWGILKIIKPIRGKQQIEIKIHIYAKSRSQILMGHTIAIIYLNIDDYRLH
ncbi:Epidermal growth factor-like domain and EGF-like calcium-binding domain and Insulin-like growth factor binding protein, N-terminal domain-containing protein [Strongyloides ratti]|uniref:Epidermal growth factor-like domain and EGF-like calcium-binding domain and Insulin-like growth factor binding protein, N-terminal domain-containing protein n=1 Tax=Strongyloides ratti TaxID=34506 RepID=A0A090L1S2_STRRB|nr:Epidermal growth factor-like domain and EGF-like calcium-binding domain and Insulin-like growth factor binding protein, N-terminal domain-containing protein [Strongyloides ratti]CEF61444.1 Epidermal growth factor-like domain and EGF-like calcium-binding domain and Insulin-like growth factor binding protein, N-terminal domain-containing protein [Strongyloides ratti]